jgi:putative membrane protein
MKKIILRILIAGGVIFGIAYLLPGLIEVTGFQAALLAALVLAVANALIRPIVLVLTLPINLLTLGLFTLAVNALMLYIVGYAVNGFMVAGFWQAVVAAMLISVVSSFMSRRVID